MDFHSVLNSKFCYEPCEHALTKESVGSSVSVFVFNLLFSCLLRLLADVDGEPWTYHPVKHIHGQKNDKMSMNV